MAKDDNKPLGPVNGYDKFDNIVNRGGSESRTKAKLRESADDANTVVKNQSDSILIETYKKRAKIANEKLQQEEDFQLVGVHDQIKRTIYNQFSEREYNRQQVVSQRSQDIPINTHRSLDWAQLTQAKHDTAQKARATIALAREGVEPGKFYNVAAKGGETSLVGGGDPYKESLIELSSHAKMSASLSGALQERRDEGEDPQSQLKYGRKLLAREANRVENVGITEGVKSGKFGDLKEESQKLIDSGAKLAEVMKKLDEATLSLNRNIPETSIALSEAAAEFKKTTEENEKQSKIVKEIKAQRDQGGQGNNVQSAIGIATSVLDVARHQFITSNVDQNNMRAAYAGVVNDNFSDQLSAGKGNAAALRRLGDYDRLTGSFGRYKTLSNTIETGMAAGVAGDAILRASGVSSATDPGKAAADAAVHLGNAAKGGISLLKGNTGAAAAFGAMQSELNMANAANAITDQSNQTFNDFAMGMGGALIGAGSTAGGKGYSSVRSNISALAKNGITPNEAVGLFAQGSAQIGTNFLKDPSTTLLAAANAQGKGQMGAGQYMGAVGQFTSVGGGQKDMEQVMANAVARGVDNAKSIAGMVHGITSLAAGSAARGVDSTAGVSQMLMSSMNLLKGNGMSEEMQQASSMNAVRGMDKFTSNTGLDIFSMQKYGSVSGLGKNTSSNINSLAIPLSVKKAWAKDPTSDKTLAGMQEYGVESFFSKDNGKGINDLIGKDVESVAFSNTVGAGAMSSEKLKKVLAMTSRKEIMAATSVSERDQYFTASGGTRTLLGDAGVLSNTPDGKPNTSDGGLTGDDSIANGLTKITADQTAQMLKLGGSLESLSAEMKKWNEKFNPKVAAEQAMGAATNMTLDKESLTNFATGSKDLVAAAKALMEYAKPGSYSPPQKRGSNGDANGVEHSQGLSKGLGSASDIFVWPFGVQK